MGARTGPFWLRIAVVSTVFAILRSIDANVAVSRTIREFTRSAGLTDWERPGPYLMLAAMFALGAAVVGLLLFRGRSLHPSVRGAALAIVMIALLAVAQSLSLYSANLLLQAEVGPTTLSRVIESILLVGLASCAAWFILDTKSGDAARHYE